MNDEKNAFRQKINKMWGCPKSTQNTRNRQIITENKLLLMSNSKSVFFC